MRSVLRIPAVLVVVCVLVAGLTGPRVLASVQIATNASTDRDALVALYEATDGDNWVNRLNWLSDAPLGTWYGVTTDDSGRVIELDLFFNQLTGTIPSELGNLTQLTQLGLSLNELSGTIPPELGNLTNLEGLYLWENELNGSIPSELGKLTNLVWLRLSHNELTGTIPPELGRLTNLIWLGLGDNKLSGTIPVELGNLYNLERLFLSKNQLSGTIPPELGSLTNLIWLALGDNELSGTIPAELGNLNNLERLSLAKNQLSGTIPLELVNLTNLKSLSLSENRLRGTIPKELGSLTKLMQLYLADNQLSGSIPSEIGKLINLNGLSLSGNRLSGCFPEVLVGALEDDDLDRLGLPFCVASSPAFAATERDVLVALYQATDGTNWANSENWLTDAPIGTWQGVTTDDSRRVEILDLRENRLRGLIPSELGNLTNLTVLNLSANRLGGTIPSELGNLTNLKVLDLSGNRLSGAIPSELGNLTNLEVLDLLGNRLSGAIPSELGNLTNMEWLDLSGNRLSGAIPSELGNLTNLEWLILFGNRLGGTIPSELGNLTNLKDLYLGFNELSGTIPSELGNLSNLKWLNLSDNRFRGCVPEEWRNVEENDLDELGLPFCVASSPTPTVVAETLTRPQVFAKVSPAIAYIQTGIASGSGVLVEGGYVVTNAHVVWPFDTARVVFPDGTAFSQVQVKGWDLLADLAVLGPVDVRVQPATLSDGESIPIGSDMYLVGYPGEVEYFPQPTIAQGTLSRLRQWEPISVTYFQADAPTEEGQSGGAHVSESGDVVGISSFWFIKGEFSLAASSTDILPRIRKLIAGEDPSGLGERRLPLEGGARRHELTLQSFGDAYILNEPAGTAIEVELSGADEGGFRVFDAYGYEVTEDETDSFSFETEYNGPHFLVVSESGSGQLTLIANRPLARFDEPDRDKQIRVGHSLHGNIDFPGDIDFFSLLLRRNETVEIVARSALADTYLAIWDSTTGILASDDDSGGGLFGVDAKVIFQAPQTGEFELFVANAGLSAPGGYVISVNRAEAAERLTPLAASGFPARQTPVVSIHNPLVIPIGDTPAVSAGVPYEWFAAGYQPPTRPTVTINGTMNVRGGPGTNYPIIGAATAGQQYAVISQNAAGDWWQIEFGGRLAWVYGGLVTASAGAANAPQADPSGWLTYEDEARGLSLSIPPGWRYFDPAQPTQADLALFSAARKGDDEQLDIAEMGALVSAMSVRSEEAVVGLGLQSDQADDASSNFMLVFSFAAGGLSLERYVQAVAGRLQDSYGVEADSVELAPELRPLGEEAVSIRYRENETNSEVWQVWLLSPDEETLLAIAFSVHSDEFAELEPLLREIVQKVRWTNQPAPTFPVVTIGGNMNVRGGPGTFYPVLGTASAGEQFAITGKTSSGSWWRIYYNEQPGWVFSQLVTASGPLEDVPLVKAYDWYGFHDGGRRLWIFYPPGWFFFDPIQTSETDRKSLGNLVGQEFAEQWLRDFAEDMDSSQKERYVGFGFKVASDSSGQIEVSAFPADGLALGQVMSIVNEGLRESGLDVDSAEMVTNLRYDGAETASIRYRDNRDGLGSERIHWQVWIISPDKGTLLRVSFSFHKSESVQLVPLLSELVRRIRWD